MQRERHVCTQTPLHKPSPKNGPCICHSTSSSASSCRESCQKASTQGANAVGSFQKKGPFQQLAIVASRLIWWVHRQYSLQSLLVLFGSPCDFPGGSKYPILKDSGPNTIKGMVFGTRDLKYWGLGPSGFCPLTEYLLWVL